MACDGTGGIEIVACTFSDDKNYLGSEDSQISNQNCSVKSQLLIVQSLSQVFDLFFLKGPSQPFPLTDIAHKAVGLVIAKHPIVIAGNSQ